MLRKLKDIILANYKIMQTDDLTINKTPTEQQCTRDAATRARVAKAIIAQQELIDMRASKQHGPDCKGMFDCTKEVCFVWEPDKIVSESYIVSRK